MASSTKLSLNFVTDDGETVNFSYNHAKKEYSAANVKALMQAMVANGEIFAKTPVTIKNAKIITTEETAIDLS